MNKLINSITRRYWNWRLVIARGVLEQDPRTYTAPDHVKRFQEREMGEAKQSRLVQDCHAEFPASPFDKQMSGEKWSDESRAVLRHLYRQFGQVPDFIDLAAAWAKRSHGAIYARLKYEGLIVEDPITREAFDALTGDPLPNFKSLRGNS